MDGQRFWKLFIACCITLLFWNRRLVIENIATTSIFFVFKYLNTLPIAVWQRHIHLYCMHNARRPNNMSCRYNCFSWPIVLRVDFESQFTICMLTYISLCNDLTETIIHLTMYRNCSSRVCDWSWITPWLPTDFMCEKWMEQLAFIWLYVINHKIINILEFFEGKNPKLISV